jgi:hypothetical protein
MILSCHSSLNAGIFLIYRSVVALSSKNSIHFHLVVKVLENKNAEALPTLPSANGSLRKSFVQLQVLRSCKARSVR